MTSDQSVPRWHAALGYALLGPPVRDLPEPGTPRIDDLLDALGGRDRVRAQAVEARAGAETWPYEIPAELREGLGAAQYAAAWTALTTALGPLTANARPVLTDRALTADERRLVADRPPHHES